MAIASRRRWPGPPSHWSGRYRNDLASLCPSLDAQKAAPHHRKVAQLHKRHSEQGAPTLAPRPNPGDQPGAALVGRCQLPDSGGVRLGAHELPNRGDHRRPKRGVLIAATAHRDHITNGEVRKLGSDHFGAAAPEPPVKRRPSPHRSPSPRPTRHEAIWSLATQRLRRAPRPLPRADQSIRASAAARRSRKKIHSRTENLVYASRAPTTSGVAWQWCREHGSVYTGAGARRHAGRSIPRDLGVWT